MRAFGPNGGRGGRREEPLERGEGEGADFVALFEQNEQNQATIRDLRQALESTRRDAEEEATILRREVENLRTIIRAADGNVGTGQAPEGQAPGSSAGNSASNSGVIDRLTRELREAESAKAAAEEESGNLRRQLAERDLQLQTTTERLNEERAARAASDLQLQGHEATAQQKQQKLQEQLADLQRDLRRVTQERDSWEAEVRRKAGEQALEARRHQAALARKETLIAEQQRQIDEKREVIAEQQRQLDERRAAGGRVLTMTIDIMCLRRAKERLEEELRAKDAELESLKARVTTPATSPSAAAAVFSPAAGSPGAARSPGAAAGAPSISVGSEVPGTTVGIASSESQKELSARLDAQRVVYEDQIKELEAELERLQKELTAKKSELGERRGELEASELQRTELENEKTALVQQLEAQKRQHDMALEHDQRSIEALTPAAVAASAAPSTSYPSAASLGSTMEDLSLEDLQEKLARREMQFQKLALDTIGLKKLIAERDATATAAVRQRDEMQRRLDWSEEERQRLEDTLVNMQAAMAQADLERENRERDVEKFIEDSTKTLQEYWNYATDFREKLEQATVREESLKAELTAMRRSSQQQSTTIRRLKNAQQQNGGGERVQQLEAQRAQLEAQRAQMQEEKAVLEGRLAQLEGQNVQLEGQNAQLERRRVDLEQRMAALEAELEERRHQRQNSEFEVDGLRREINEMNNRWQEEHDLRVQAEEVSALRQDRIDSLQARLANGFNEDQDALTREMEGHNQTRALLEEQREAVTRLERTNRELQEGQTAIHNIGVPDRRNPGHLFQLRQRRAFNCRSCRAVRHGFYWRCRNNNCQDVYCTDCVARDAL